MTDLNEARAKLDELERRVVHAARNERPSEELSQRMAAAIGLSPLALQDLPSPQSPSAQNSPEDVSPMGDVGQGGGLNAAGGGATASSAWSPVVAWGTGIVVAGGLAVLALRTVAGDSAPTTPASGAGVLVASTVTDQDDQPGVGQQPAEKQLNDGDGNNAAAHEQKGQITPDVTDLTQNDRDVAAPTKPAETDRGRSAAGSRARASNPQSRGSANLADQIELVDEVRAAVRGGASERALVLASEYRSSYPRGSFHPEVTALRVEALMNLGRHGEAKSLAKRFVSRNRGGPLSERIARLAGIEQD